VSGADKRVSARFAVELSAELEIPSGRIHRGLARNLSRGGICFETTGVLAAGDEVVVRVRLIFDEDRTSEPLELPARVVWCTPLGDAQQIGTQFLPLSQDRSTYLDMFLRYLELHASSGADGSAAGSEDEDDPFSA
jgi:PilZ domain